MKIMQKIWDEFVYGGHFLALGDAVTLYVLAIILNIPVTWNFLLIIYLCVFSANLYNRGKESETDIIANQKRVKVMKKYTDNMRFILPIFLTIVAILLIYFANLNVLLFAGVIFLISILYSVFLKGMTSKIVGFKSFVAAFFYALMVFLLVFYYSAPVTLAVCLVFTFYYLRIFISAGFCDIKDMKADKKDDLKTFAVAMGKEKTIKVLTILNLMSAAPVIVGVYINMLPMFSLAILLTIPYAFYYFQKSTSDDIDRAFLYNVVVDGEFIFWLPYVILGGLIL